MERRWKWVKFPTEFLRLLSNEDVNWMLPRLRRMHERRIQNPRVPSRTHFASPDRKGALTVGSVTVSTLPGISNSARGRYGNGELDEPARAGSSLPTINYCSWFGHWLGKLINIPEMRSSEFPLCTNLAPLENSGRDFLLNESNCSGNAKFFARWDENCFPRGIRIWANWTRGKISVPLFSLSQNSTYLFSHSQ